MGTLVDIKLPDIGDFTEVDVIEVMVKPGDRVRAEDSLITIESDKATMEVPSPQAGVVKELKVKLGDKVSEGSPIVVLETEAPAADMASKPEPKGTESAAEPRKEPAPKREKLAAAEAPRTAAAAPPVAAEAASDANAAVPSGTAESAEHLGTKPHASPSVRKFARQLGADLSLVTGSG
ncbi:MAG: biotin/lipoyl-containing protein, partial [Candidatus Binataceae bacterium]